MIKLRTFANHRLSSGTVCKTNIIKKILYSSIHYFMHKISENQTWSKLCLVHCTRSRLCLHVHFIYSNIQKGEGSPVGSLQRSSFKRLYVWGLPALLGSEWDLYLQPILFPPQYLKIILFHIKMSISCLLLVQGFVTHCSSMLFPHVPCKQPCDPYSTVNMKCRIMSTHVWFSWV